MGLQTESQRQEVRTETPIAGLDKSSDELFFKKLKASVVVSVLLLFAFATARQVSAGLTLSFFHQLRLWGVGR